MHYLINPYNNTYEVGTITISIALMDTLRERSECVAQGHIASNLSAVIRAKALTLYICLF